MDFDPKPINQPTAPPALQPAAAEPSFYRANKYYIWVSVFAILIIAILAYFAFKPAAPAAVKEANVEVELQAPETLPSGNEAVYRIAMRNKDSAKLTDLELEITYPQGFTYEESSPKAQNISGSVFSVPDLLPGQNVSVIIKAKSSGDVNSEKRLTARLHYKYANFNSTFVKESAHTMRLTASDVALEIQGPKETNVAQLVAFTVSYKNNSKDIVKNTRLKATYPQGFNFAASQPTPSLGQDTWNVGDLQSGGEGKITIQGTFASSQPGEQKTLKIQLESLGQDGQYFVQNSAEAVTAITSQPLLVALENQDSQGGGLAAPGDMLNFNVNYQNNAPIAASAVNIVVTLDSKVLDLSSFQAQGAQISGSTLSWNASGVPGLELLNPGESGSLHFSVRIKDPATKDSSKNLTVNISSKIKASEYNTFLPGGQEQIKISSPVKVQTALSFTTGSLPPKVGTKSVYKVTLQLLNSSNDFTEAEVSCFLPTIAGSFDPNSVSAAERQNVQFDPASGKITWKVAVLPAYSGKFSPARTLEFETSINPSLSEAGSSPVLVRGIRLSAKDNFTQSPVSASAQDLNTASLAGQSGFINGIVAQ